MLARDYSRSHDAGLHKAQDGHKRRILQATTPTRVQHTTPLQPSPHMAQSDATCTVTYDLVVVALLCVACVEMSLKKCGVKP